MNRVICARTWMAGSLLGIFCGAAFPVFGASLTRTSSFDYDSASGQLIKEVVEPDNSALCVVTQYGYDSFGNKTSVTMRNCNGSTGNNGTIEAPAPTGDAVFSPRTTATQYDAQGRFPVSVTNALLQTETRLYDPRFGIVIQVIGPNNLPTTFGVDTFGRKTDEMRLDQTSTKLEYLWCQSVNGGTETCPPFARYLVRVTPKLWGGSQNGPISKTYRDALDREIRVETQGFDGTPVYKDTSYDAQGRVASVKEPYYSNGTPTTVTSYGFDALGRVTRVTTQPQGGGSGMLTSIAYSGLTVTTTVSNATYGGGTNMPQAVPQTKTVTKNREGQTVSVVDSQGNTITYVYDPFGNPLTTNAAGVATSFTYDLRGRKTGMVDPDTGTWSYVYDALGQLIRQTDAKGQVTTMAYDTLGRMTGRSEPDLVSSWTYDSCAMGIGKLCQTSATNGYTRSIGYDEKGRVSSATTVIDTTYSVSYGYDPVSRRLTSTQYPASPLYPNGFVVKNVYNSLGYLWKVTDNAGATVYWQATAVSATGNVLSETLGNGLTSTRTYNHLDLMQSNVVSNGASSLQNSAYTYDTVGNLTNRSESVTGVSESFVYDTLNRLMMASQPGLPTQSFNYSPTGNITYKSDVGTYAYGGAGPHAVTSISGTANGFTNPSLTYDANGNLTSSLGRTISYTSSNLPLQVSGVGFAGGASYTYSYAYDSDHQRVRLVHSTRGTFIYLNPGNGQLIYEKETKPSGLIEHKHYISAGGLLIGVYKTRSDSTQATEYYHKDRLGSITLITDSSGTVIERLAYDSFGKRRNTNGVADPTNLLASASTDRGFTAHEHLDQVELINMNARVYDPVLGRFMTADVIVESPGNLQSYNRYTYAWNNPLGYTDPTGRGWIKDKVNDVGGVVGRVFDFVVVGVEDYVGLGVDPVYRQYLILDSLRRETNRALLKYEWARDLASAASVWACGPPCAAAFAAYMTHISGGSWGEALYAAGVAYGSALAFNDLNRLPVTDFQSGFAMVYGSAVIGGSTAAFQGGDFQAGMGRSALISLAQVVATSYVASWEEKTGNKFGKGGCPNCETMRPDWESGGLESGMDISVSYSRYPGSMYEIFPQMSAIHSLQNAWLLGDSWQYWGSLPFAALVTYAAYPNR